MADAKQADAKQAAGDKAPAGYEEVAWHGRPAYRCRKCPYAVLSRMVRETDRGLLEIKAHVASRHPGS